MKLFIFSAALLATSMANFAENLSDNAINMNSNFKKSPEKKECNVFDEAAYCQLIAYDSRGAMVANSMRCTCPNGYRCPEDVDDSLLDTSCLYDDSRHWYRCSLRCVPIDA